MKHCNVPLKKKKRTYLIIRNKNHVFFLINRQLYNLLQTTFNLKNYTLKDTI